VLELVADGRVPYAGEREIVVQRAHLDIEDGVWRLTRPTTIAWGGDDGLHVRDLEFRNAENDGHVALDGRVLPLDRADVRIDVARVPIGDVQRLLGREPVVSGDLWSAGTFRAIAAVPELDMTFRLDSGAVLGVQLSRLDGTVQYRNGALVTNAVAAFDTAGVLDVELAVPFRFALADSVEMGLGESGAISGRIIADSVLLAPFDALLTDVRDMGGHITGEVAIGGTIEEPRLDGALQVINGALTIPVLDQSYDSINGTATLAGRVVTIPGLTARAGGMMTVSGTIELEELTEPVFHLAASMQDFDLMGMDDEAPAEVSGTVNIEGALMALVLTGGVSVTDGAVLIPDLSGSTLDEEIFLEGGEMRIDDPLAATGNPVLDNLTVRGLRVDVGGDVWFVLENQARVQLGGVLTVNKTGEDWRIVGELEGERGTYTLYAGPIVRRFDINYARLTFQDETELNPTLEVLASRTIIDQTGRPVDVDVSIGGTMQAPTLSLGSGDAANIPQSELLSFLFFGQPSFALGGGALPGSDLLEQTFVGGIAELASIELQNELGEAGLPLDVFQIRLGGFGALEGAPMLVLGRELADDVFLTVESYLSGLFGSSQSGLDLWAIRLEWAFDRRSSLRAGLEPASSVLRLRGIGLDRPSAPGQQFSLELRRRWTY
jgi:translocation and assembly module TamB